jgi:Ca2+-binding EF-hand superfamily protein
MWSTFRLFDRKGNGKLSVALVTDILHTLKNPLSETEIAKLLDF